MKINHGLMLVSACLSLGLVETVNYQTTTQTIQADSTANKNFKQIKLGMNKRQVIDTLGKPAHDKYEDNVWTYPLKDQKSVSLIFKKDTLENISDRTAISSKNSVVKKATKKTIKQNINTAFSNYFKQAKEYAKAGQTEFAWSTMIQKVTFDGDDKLKITTVDGFNTTPAHEKDVIAKKISDLGRSFLHRYNKQDFDLKFYENGHKIGSSDNDQLTKFEWKVQK